MAPPSPLRLRIPKWCAKVKVAIGGEASREVAPGKNFYEIRRMWRPGDVVTLEMPMAWRRVRGRKSLEGRAALMRGPVLYCIGTAQNAELLKQFKDPGELVFDPRSLGQPVPDESVRPGGLKVLAKAWPPGKSGQGPASLDTVLTEFADPSGIAVQ